jgi:hypothetical protein
MASHTHTQRLAGERLIGRTPCRSGLGALGTRRMRFGGVDAVAHTADILVVRFHRLHDVAGALRLCEHAVCAPSRASTGAIRQPLPRPSTYGAGHSCRQCQHSRPNSTAPPTPVSKITACCQASPLSIRSTTKPMVHATNDLADDRTAIGKLRVTTSPLCPHPAASFKPAAPFGQTLMGVTCAVRQAGSPQALSDWPPCCPNPDQLVGEDREGEGSPDMPQRQEEHHRSTQQHDVSLRMAKQHDAAARVRRGSRTT